MTVGGLSLVRNLLKFAEAFRMLLVHLTNDCTLALDRLNHIFSSKCNLLCLKTPVVSETATRAL
jgi:hypothetical protein